MVKLALQPGASVARIAREHDINDNLLFKWLRLWQNEGRLSHHHTTPSMVSPIWTQSCREIVHLSKTTKNIGVKPAYFD
ncbi:TPA: transposase [Escherichia coli]|nr:hypothetical protein [Escherichia coli]EFD5000086.1 transposase [Escherichia coli]EFE7184583.1 transposase [Escherichia coli]EFE8157952.1 transposase [Escherichia coli]EFH2556852.1 transposase [Escherichia coli]